MLDFGDIKFKAIKDKSLITCRENLLCVYGVFFSCHITTVFINTPVFWISLACPFPYLVVTLWIKQSGNYSMFASDDFVLFVTSLLIYFTNCM